jgi:hypothetical protein
MCAPHNQSALVRSKRPYLGRHHTPARPSLSLHSAPYLTNVDVASQNYCALRQSSGTESRSRRLNHMFNAMTSTASGVPVPCASLLMSSLLHRLRRSVSVSSQRMASGNSCPLYRVHPVGLGHYREVNATERSIATAGDGPRPANERGLDLAIFARWPDFMRVC